MLEQIWEVSLIFFYSSLMNECSKMNLAVFFTFKGRFPPRIVCVWDCKIVFCARLLVSVAYFTSTQSAFILTRIVFVFLCVHRNIRDFAIVLSCMFVDLCVCFFHFETFSLHLGIVIVFVCSFSCGCVYFHLNQFSFWQLLYLCLWFFCVFIKMCLCFVSPLDNPPSSCFCL